MSFLRSLRKLVLGETWMLPAGVVLAVGIAAIVRVLAGADGWWRDAGGLVLAAALVGALVAALVRRSG
jgi:hypothetical protein